MRRRRNPKSGGAGVSLFPFLAVLLCTMGALIVVLIVIARQSRPDLEDSEATAAGAALKEEWETKQADLKWRIEQLRSARQATLAQLERQRQELSHLEDHTRRLSAQLEELESARSELDKVASGERLEYDLLKKEIADAESRIAAKKAEIEKSQLKARQGGRSYAVVPYHGPNETRRRPIYIECRADGVIIQPEGLVLTEKDFEGDVGPGNPLASALRAAREYLGRTQMPGEGAAYPLLLIRPDGFFAYECVINAMSSWGSEFGYELIGQDWPIEYPPPDPRLALAMRQAISEGRLRQAYLARAAPRLMHSGGQHATFRASPTGGIMRDDGMPLGGRSRSTGRPSWSRGRPGRGQVAGSRSGDSNGSKPNKLSGNPYRAALASQAHGAGAGRDGATGAYAGRGAGSVFGTGAGGDSILGFGAAPSVGPDGANNSGGDRYGRGGAGLAGGTGNAPAAGGSLLGGAPGEGRYGTNKSGGDRYGRGGGELARRTGSAPAAGDSLLGGGAGGAGRSSGSNLLAASGGRSAAQSSPYGTGNGSGRYGGTRASGERYGANGRYRGGPRIGGTGSGGAGRGWGMAREKLAEGAARVRSGRGGTTGGAAGNGSGNSVSSGKDGAGMAGRSLAAGAAAGTSLADRRPGGAGRGVGTRAGDGTGSGGTGSRGTGSGGAGSGGTGSGRTGADAGIAGSASEQPPGAGAVAADRSGAAGANAESGKGPGTGASGQTAGGEGGTGQNRPGESGSPAGASEGEGPVLADAKSGAASSDASGNAGAQGGVSSQGSTSPTGGSLAQTGSALQGGSTAGGSVGQPGGGSGASGGSAGSPGGGGGSSSGGNAGQGGGASQQQQATAAGMPAMPMPNFMFGKKPKSIAEQRGEQNWANPAANHYSSPLTRPIKVVCDADHLTVLPEGRARRGYKVIELNDQTDDGVRDLVESVWDRVETWGAAGQGMYWRPELLMEVEPGGEQRYAELKALLSDSGLDVRGRRRRAPVVQYPRTRTPN